MRLLTKDLFLCGLQSKAYLWRAANDADSLPKPSGQALLRMQDGQEVGKLAQSLFPGGVSVPFLNNELNFNRTREALALRKPIYEAGFSADGCAARIDILVPSGEDSWDIYEVKATSEVKAEHIPDVAFQKFVCSGAGIKIHRCFVMHLNKEYVRHGPISVSELLVSECVDEAISSFDVGPRVVACKEVLGLPTCPVFAVSDLLTSEDDCPLVVEFYGSLPVGSVFDLPRGKKKAIELFSQGISLLRDIPPGYKLAATQIVPVRAAASGRHVDRTAIASFLSRIIYPVHFLDFEAFNTAVPLYDGCKPYQQIPFQYSLHIETATGTVTHKYFLHDSDADPRPALLSSLLADLGDSGTILVYNQSFEEGRLHELASAFPLFSARISAVIARLYDLAIPFKSYAFYDVRQRGSYSIKNVLPLFSSLNYASLPICNGGSALSEYVRVYVKTDRADEARVRSALLAYCEQDTLAMKLVVDGLRKVT